MPQHDTDTDTTGPDTGPDTGTHTGTGTSTETHTAMSRLRQAQDRSFDREGVPMFLVLTSTGTTPAAVGVDAVAEGKRLAAELTEVRSALFPTRRDDDMGCLVATVQALTVGTFEPEASL